MQRSYCQGDLEDEKQMKTDYMCHKSFVLIEGPSYADATFYGSWLLDAAKANELQGEIVDPEFQDAIIVLQITPDFDTVAMRFVSRFIDKELQLFLIDTNSTEELLEFVLMVEMGFFVPTGDHYQMTLPQHLDLDSIKQAYLRLAATNDADWIHPECLVVDLPYSEAQKYQQLRKLAQDQRSIRFLH